MKILKQGAEAILYLKDERLIKERISKGYRIKEIDTKIRKLRTRGEGKLLMRVENTPKVFNVDEDKSIIEMEFIDGELIKDVLDSFDSEKRERICREIGVGIAGMHNKNMIHGDLTTSNMIFRDKLYFIDFGLGFMSERIEDKAVDLRLLKQAFESKHYKIADECFGFVLEGYKECERYGEVMKRLINVCGRGRYKGKNGKKVKL